MKKCFSRYRLALFVLSVMSWATFANVVWDGPNAPDVIDQDLVIKDDVLLRVGGTNIEAIHKDITITLKRDVKVSGNWAGESQLYLKAAEGRTIHFVVDNNLTFVGSDNKAADTDLLIVQSGPGLVDVGISEGKRFKITAEGSAGVQMYVLMYGGLSAPCEEYCSQDEYCCDEYCADEYCLLGNGQHEHSESVPTLRFRALPTEEYSSENRKVVIGKKSRLSFLSSRPTDFAQDSGYIEFDASSSSFNRMILKIKDTGAFTVAGHFTCQRNGGCITTANIDLSVAAGFQAIWSIINSRGENISAGLLVLNENKTMFDLLQDPFGDLNVTRAFPNYIGNFSGKRYGVVVGANGVMWAQDNAYLDYVGLALNQKSDTPSCGFRSHALVDPGSLKPRNPSALFIDGNHNPNATPAQFWFGNFAASTAAAAFFRSGVANDGSVRDENDVNPFTIDASQHTKGVGNIVFDVEGQLNVFGLFPDGGVTSKIELLSLEVLPTGGSLFVGSSEKNFPARTFSTEDGELLAYNTGAFLINNHMNLHNTSLSHTDVNHHVFQDNDVLSEPAYIGGESFKLFGQTRQPVQDGSERPAIRFIDSRLLVNADIALTGVDLVVPNHVDEDEFQLKNNVDFVFYSSGACIDNGTGRQMVLGTRIGSTAINGTRIDSDAHLDVMQIFDAIAEDYPPTDTDDHVLHMLVDFNSAAITDVTPQPGFSIHTIFLGNKSNISIGTNADTTGFNLETHPWMRLQGNFFSFTTRGGLSGCPSTSNITGQGGIFVDLNGKLSIDPGFMASFCVLVTKTRNGIVDLPAGQVFFCDNLGVVNGDIDLSSPEGQILVGPGESVADLVLNWQILKKDCANFVPFQPVGPCCPTVTPENVSSLPRIEGTVNNLIIEGSRLGDAATFVVSGGTVRHIEFAINSNGCCLGDCENISGQAPVATIVLENNGTVVLGDEGVGAVGIVIIANGSGRVDLAGNLTLASQCAFVKGPDFAEGDVLTISSDIAHEIILPSGANLDLRSFDVETDLVQFTGESQLAVEPGASIITGLGTLSFADNSQIRFEAAANVTSFFQAIPHGAHDETLPPLQSVPAADIHNQYDFLTNFGAGLNNTDAFRIHLMGQGALELRDNAQAFILHNAIVAVETRNDATCPVDTTDFELRLLDNAQFIIGELNLTQGGVLQIGNVVDQNLIPRTRQGAQSVSFTLTINGPDANFFIGSQGLMGLGVGVERIEGIDPVTGLIVPNEDIVNTLFNVNSITFNFLEGRFEHDRIFRGDDPNASLFAINGDESIVYNVITDTTPDADGFGFILAGGGNMILTYPPTPDTMGGIHPIVLDQDGQVEVAPGIFDPRLWTSIMASSALQNNDGDEQGLTGLELFDLLKTHDAVLEPSRPNTFGRANAAPVGVASTPDLVAIRIDTVSEGVIIRGDAFDIIGANGIEAEDRQLATQTGAVFVNIDQGLNEILTVTTIQP